MRVFDIAFRSSARLRDVVRAGPHVPLPPIPRAPVLPPVPPPRSADDVHREERQIVEQTLSAMRQAIEQLATRQEANLAEMRQATVELALAVAGRVVFDKLQAGDFPIEEMVRQAIARLPTAPEIVTYLHPHDLALLRRRLDEVPASPRLEADPTLPRGGCRAEAGEIHVLADLAGQLAELRSQLLWSVSHARSGSEPTAS